MLDEASSRRARPAATKRAQAGGPEGEYRSLTQIVTTKLRQSIYDGTIFDDEYGPGARLNITDLAKRLNVSAVPIREALRRLEAEDLVEFRLNRGVVVRQLSAAELRELFLVRLPLETLAAVEATRRADAKSVRLLGSTLEEMDGVEYGPDWNTIHERFHQELYAIGGLPRLGQLIAGLRGQMRPYARLYQDDPQQRRLIQSEHYEMVNALRKRDEQKIVRLIGEHISRPARVSLAKLSAGKEMAAEFATR